MLPLNHADTPPVSICEAAPVPYVSLWGTEQASQSTTEDKAELKGGHPWGRTSMQPPASTTVDAEMSRGRGGSDLLHPE